MTVQHLLHLRWAEKLRHLDASLWPHHLKALVAVAVAGARLVAVAGEGLAHHLFGRQHDAERQEPYHQQGQGPGLLPVLTGLGAA